MGLQTQNLVMVGLGVLDDNPPNNVQPPLVDGIHLRWAFKRELGFPWYGFYLFRRLHQMGQPDCVREIWSDGPEDLSTKLNTYPDGLITSDQPLFRTAQFGGVVQCDLADRSYLRFTFPAGKPARWLEVELVFREYAEIVVTAYSGDIPVGQTQVVNYPNKVSAVQLEFDTITSVELSSGPVVLTNICFVPVSQDETLGWERVPNFPYPLCLPIIHPDYPCSGGTPEDPDTARVIAQNRVLYDVSNDWSGEPFSELYDQLKKLVEGGPSSTPMADRSLLIQGTPDPPDPGIATPTMPELYPLDMVLLSALHPAIAQMVGLYWVDQEAEPYVPYDYLILMDRTGTFYGDADYAIEQIIEGFSYVDGYIVFNKTMAPARQLPPPDDLRVYALPGTTLRVQGGGLKDASNNAGLRWELGVIDLGTQQVLLPDRPLMYHLWRADHGQMEPASTPPADKYQLLTKDQPILVAEPESTLGNGPQVPADWPSFPLHAIDMGLPDGWYSFQVSGIDIFGRHSPSSAPGTWYQWTPVPDPKPWYYKDPPSDAVVHSFAVRLLDKTPPPPPTAIEAYALDPADPTVLKDKAYNDWWATLSSDERKSAIGLRVRWQWSQPHMRQAPDTREFRIYFHPGTNLPSDYKTATQWQERYYVVAHDKHVTITTDSTGQPLRKYEIFLPAPGDTLRDGLPMLPTLAKPIIYAHIGVSAADNKAHTLDNPKWLSGYWGGVERFGNEGRIGAPAKIFRVLREPPDPPIPPPDSEKVFATPADYHGHSFYTYRWQPQQHLKTHIFRALDDALFKVDWSHQPRAALTASQLEFFPKDSIEPKWTEVKRQQVANELNKLNTFKHDLAGSAQAMIYYRGLSNDGLRILTGLPGNEHAFNQLTIQPLNPDDPANANRVGPDNPSDFTVNASLRTYLDTLDGRSTNRYFYRSAYVDGAHNRSELSLSGPPVWLPNVVAPRAPVLTKVLGGDQKITLRWASNREPDLMEYRIYRTDNKESTRDLRLMTLVHTKLVPQGNPAARPAEVSWTDEPVRGLVNFYYRLVAVDEAGNISHPSQSLTGRAFDESLPIPPEPTVTWAQVGSNLRAQIAWTSVHEILVQRRQSGGGTWVDLAQWRAPGSYAIKDPFSDPSQAYEYRLWAREYTGATVKGQAVTLQPAS